MLRLTLCKMLQGGWNSTNWSCDDLGPLSWGPQNQPPPCHPPPPLHHHHPWHWYVKPYYVLVASCWILTFLTSSCKQDLIQNCLLPIVGFAFLHQNNVLEFWSHVVCCSLQPCWSFNVYSGLIVWFVRNYSFHFIQSSKQNLDTFTINFVFTAKPICISIFFSLARAPWLTGSGGRKN